MEIGLVRKGDLQVLTVKGRIRLQSWRVVDKHLDAMLEKGCRQLILDVSEVTLICSTGVGALFHNIKKFQDRRSRLLLFAAKPYMREILGLFGGEAFVAEHVVPDWEAAARRLGGAQ